MKTGEAAVIPDTNTHIIPYLTFLPFHSYFPNWPNKPDTMVYKICKG